MRRKIGFLFLGPVTHLHHAASIAFELAAFPEVEVTIFVASELNQRTVHALAAQYGCACTTEFLRPGPLHRFVRRFKKRLHPRVRHVLGHNAARLRGCDALVVTDRTFLEGRGRRPLHILTGHGAGYRPQGLYPELWKFDLVLLPGPDKLQRFVAEGFPRERLAMVGYPKFDLVQRARPQAPPLFANANPVVLYNPHINPEVSSWQAWHQPILDYFLANRDFNLVFAPHMLLYSKQRGGVAQKYLDADNILVDLDSPALIDMTYSSQADLYLGEGSSQVHEFVAWRNRPCVFLNPRRIAWQHNPNFSAWRMGAVVEDIATLDRELRSAPRQFETTYRAAQEQLVRETFSITDEPAGRRAARAIVELLARQPA
jgi:hypothetical protein